MNIMAEPSLELFTNLYYKSLSVQNLQIAN